MNNKVSKTISKLVVDAAVQTFEWPGEYCTLFLGEAKPKMSLQSKDYKEMVLFLKNTNMEC